jgi:hypothetical protein
VLFKIESVRGEQFGWAFKAEGFARSRVQIPGDFVEFVLRKEAEIGALFQVLPQEAVGVFVACQEKLNLCVNPK